jgi:hypothetical protein
MSEFLEFSSKCDIVENNLTLEEDPLSPSGSFSCDSNHERDLQNETPLLDKMKSCHFLWKILNLLFA